MVSYMSSSTNSFSGDFLLLAIASPKLRSMCTLESVTSAKHFSRCGSRWYHIWSQSFLSAANKSFTCRCSKPAKMMGDLWGNLLLHFQFGIKHTMPGIQIPWRISLNLQELINNQVRWSLQKYACTESSCQSFPQVFPIAFSELHPCSTSQLPASVDFVLMLRPAHLCTQESLMRKGNQPGLSSQYQVSSCTESRLPSQQEGVGLTWFLFIGPSIPLMMKWAVRTVYMQPIPSKIITLQRSRNHNVAAICLEFWMRFWSYMKCGFIT